MTDRPDKLSVFEQLRIGLEDSLAHTRGQLSLKTTELPAPPPRADAAQVTRVRRRLKMSQAVFAATLNVSPRTVQSWEQGRRAPGDAALRLLQLVDVDPGVVARLFATRRPGGRSTPAPQRRPRAARRRTTG